MVSKLGDCELGSDTWASLAMGPVGDGAERRAGCGGEVRTESTDSSKGELLGCNDTGENHRLPGIYPILNMRSGVSIQKPIDVVL